MREAIASLRWRSRDAPILSTRPGNRNRRWPPVDDRHTVDFRQGASLVRILYPVQPHEKLSWRHQSHASVGAEYEKVPITGHDLVRPGRHGSGQYEVVVLVAADTRRQGHRLDQPDLSSKGVQKRIGRRSHRKLAAQARFKLLQQRGR